MAPAALRPPRAARNPVFCGSFDIAQARGAPKSDVVAVGAGVKGPNAPAPRAACLKEDDGRWGLEARGRAPSFGVSRAPSAMVAMGGGSGSKAPELEGLEVAAFTPRAGACDGVPVPKGARDKTSLVLKGANAPPGFDAGVAAPAARPPRRRRISSTLTTADLRWRGTGWPPSSSAVLSEGLDSAAAQRGITTGCGLRRFAPSCHDSGSDQSFSICWPVAPRAKTLASNDLTSEGNISPFGPFVAV